MSDLAGRNILITGANTGIGRETALSLAGRGARLVIAGRSKERTQAAIDACSAAGAECVDFLALDLGDLNSVRKCADAFIARGEPLDILINNAGLAAAKGATAQGFEMAFGVNHLGHYLFTELLLDTLRDSSDPRIVIVASNAHFKAKSIDFDAFTKPTKTATGFPEYCVSKLCNVLHSRALAKRLEGTGIKTYSLHPGVVATDVWRNVPWPIRPIMKRFMITEADGAKTSLYCATSPDVKDHNGRYYDECAEKRPSSLARDDAIAEELMERSASWVS